MAIRVEALHSWLEVLIYQTTVMSHQESSLRLGGAIAGAKAFATQTLELCAREASQYLWWPLIYPRRPGRYCRETLQRGQSLRHSRWFRGNYA